VARRAEQARWIGPASYSTDVQAKKTTLATGAQNAGEWSPRFEKPTAVRELPASIIATGARPGKSTLQVDGPSKAAKTRRYD